MKKKPFLFAVLIWLCILAVLILIDTTILANIRVNNNGVEIAPYRLLTPPIFMAELVPKRGTCEELESLLGPPTDWVLYSGENARELCYDLQWGGFAFCRTRDGGETYIQFTVTHTRLGTGRWLILPGIMLAVAIAEVVVYKHRKKKKTAVLPDETARVEAEVQP